MTRDPQVQELVKKLKDGSASKDEMIRAATLLDFADHAADQSENIFIRKVDQPAYTIADQLGATQMVLMNYMMLRNPEQFKDAVQESIPQ